MQAPVALLSSPALVGSLPGRAGLIPTGNVAFLPLSPPAHPQLGWAPGRAFPGFTEERNKVTSGDTISAAAPGLWPGPCPWLRSAGLRLRAHRCRCRSRRSRSGSSAPAPWPGTSTRPPSSSGPAPPPWAWRARGPASAPCSAASSSATPGTPP